MLVVRGGGGLIMTVGFAAVGGGPMIGGGVRLAGSSNRTKIAPSSLNQRSGGYVTAGEIQNKTKKSLCLPILPFWLLSSRWYWPTEWVQTKTRRSLTSTDGGTQRFLLEILLPG